jgi:hypothetical protein
MDIQLIFKLCFPVFLPLIVLSANAMHFVLCPPESRRPFLLPPVTTFSLYMKTHWLLVIAIVCLALSYFWDLFDTPFHLLIVIWFLYVNIYAIERRQIQKKRFNN